MGWNDHIDDDKEPKKGWSDYGHDTCEDISQEDIELADRQMGRLAVKQPKMTPAQYADFMAKHAKAGERTNKRRAYFRGSK